MVRWRTRLGVLLAWFPAALQASPSSLRDLVRAILWCRLIVLLAAFRTARYERRRLVVRKRDRDAVSMRPTLACYDAYNARRDASGRRFACRAKALIQEEPTRPPPGSLGDLLETLQGVCARLSLGWWTYEWCHREEIRQFHQSTTNGPRSPDWSLGKYSGSIGAADDDVPQGLEKAVDTFDIGGQRCDETRTGRKSRVTFGCCRDGATSRTRSAKRSSSKKAAAQSAFLVSVEETALCEYALSVCAPSLCMPESSNATVSRLLSSLEGSCLRRPEGWWEFEFCYKKHVRQYHVENREYVAEFSLGKFEPSSLSTEEDAVVVTTPDDDEPRVEIEYKGGTECDTTTNAKRSTTVRLLCGEKPMFSSVVEDRTCHYVFTVHTPVLCRHPAFAAFYNPSSRPVQCEEVEE